MNLANQEEVRAPKFIKKAWTKISTKKPRESEYITPNKESKKTQKNKRIVWIALKKNEI